MGRIFLKTFVCRRDFVYRGGHIRKGDIFEFVYNKNENTFDSTTDNYLRFGAIDFEKYFMLYYKHGEECTVDNSDYEAIMIDNIVKERSKKHLV